MTTLKCSYHTFQSVSLPYTLFAAILLFTVNSMLSAKQRNPMLTDINVF